MSAAAPRNNFFYKEINPVNRLIENRIIVRRRVVDDSRASLGPGNRQSGIRPIFPFFRAPRLEPGLVILGAGYGIGRIGPAQWKAWPGNRKWPATFRRP